MIIEVVINVKINDFVVGVFNKAKNFGLVRTYCFAVVEFVLTKSNLLVVIKLGKLLVYMVDYG